MQITSAYVFNAFLYFIFALSICLILFLIFLFFSLYIYIKNAYKNSYIQKASLQKTTIFKTSSDNLRCSQLKEKKRRKRWCCDNERTPQTRFTITGSLTANRLVLMMDIIKSLHALALTTCVCVSMFSSRRYYCWPSMRVSDKDFVLILDLCFFFFFLNVNYW